MCRSLGIWCDCSSFHLLSVRRNQNFVEKRNDGSKHWTVENESSSREATKIYTAKLKRRTARKISLNTTCLYVVSVFIAVCRSIRIYIVRSFVCLLEFLVASIFVSVEFQQPYSRRERLNCTANGMMKKATKNKSYVFHTHMPKNIIYLLFSSLLLLWTPDSSRARHSRSASANLVMRRIRRAICSHSFGFHLELFQTFIFGLVRCMLSETQFSQNNREPNRKKTHQMYWKIFAMHWAGHNTAHIFRFKWWYSSWVKIKTARKSKQNATSP